MDEDDDTCYYWYDDGFVSAMRSAAYKHSDDVIAVHHSYSDSDAAVEEGRHE